MNKDYVLLKTPKNHSDFFCPLCGQKSYALDEPQPCDHVIYIEVGDHISYIHPKIQQMFDVLMQEFEKKSQLGDRTSIEPNMQDVLNQFNSSNYLHVIYSEQNTSIPFAGLDVHIRYQISNSSSQINIA